MTDISATLAAIDAVVGCHQCGGELGDSPHDDFCSERCSKLWAAGRVGAEVEDGPWSFYRQRWLISAEAPSSYPYATYGVASSQEMIDGQRSTWTDPVLANLASGGSVIRRDGTEIRATDAEMDALQGADHLDPRLLARLVPRLWGLFRD